MTKALVKRVFEGLAVSEGKCITITAGNRHGGVQADMVLER